MTVPGLALRKRRVWLFDLDGTLVDSTPAHELAFRAALRETEPRLGSGFRYAEYAGLSTRAVAHALRIAPQRVEQFVAAKQSHYRRMVDRGAVVRFAGVTEVLERLTMDGATCRLVTGASRGSADRVLAATGLRNYFHSVHTADDVCVGKPDPTIYRLALGSDPVEEAIAVEDSAVGVRAAVAAGILALQVHAVDPAPGAVTLPTFAALAQALREEGSYTGTESP